MNEELKNTRKLQKEMEERQFLSGEQYTIDKKLNRKKREKKLKMKDVFEVKGVKNKMNDKELGPITKKASTDVPVFNYKLK